jgi:hypothetical protein
MTPTPSPFAAALRQQVKSISQPTETPNLTDPTNQRATIQETFGLGALVTKTAARSLQQDVEAITELLTKENWSPADWADAAKAISTISVLVERAPNSPAQDNWEYAADHETLKDLREKIAQRTLSRLEIRFARTTVDSVNQLEVSMRPLRIVSKPVEIAICTEEGQPPAHNSRYNASGIWKVGTVPFFMEELTHTLAQICLYRAKKTGPVLSPEEAETLKTLRAGLLTGRRAPNNSKATAAKASLKSAEWLKTRIETLKFDNLVEAMGDQLAEFMEKSFPSEEGIALTLQEKEKFKSEIEEIGTELAGIDDLQKTEFDALKKLEEAYDILAACQAPKDLESPGALEIRIFQDITGLSPTMGKASAVVMTTKLLQDPEFLEKYTREGRQQILDHDLYRTHITITDSEDPSWNSPLETEEYLTPAEEIQTAVNLLAQADQALYSEPLLSAIAHKDRKAIVESARRVFNHTQSPNLPLDQTLTRIYKNTEEMIGAINKEIAGEERNLDLLPVALREAAAQEKTTRALTRLVEMCGKASPDIENLALEIDQQIPTLKAEIQALQEDPEENAREIENAQKELNNLIRKRDTLQTFLELGQDMDNSRNAIFTSLAATLEVRQVPKTDREHALISVCDGKKIDGTPLLVMETAQMVQNVTGIKGFLNALRADILVLRQWKNREIEPKTPKGSDLAYSICRTPENLRKALKNDLAKALLACTEAKPWHNPLHVDAKDGQASLYSAYLIAKPELEAAVKPSDPHTENLLEAIKGLYHKTEEIFRNSPGNWVRTEKLAEALEEKGPNSLKELRKKVAESTLMCQNSAVQKLGVEFLTTWHKATGYIAAIRREALSVKPSDQRESELKGNILANRIHVKIHNLMELHGYLSAVASSPDALAETYLQHRLATNIATPAGETPKENWEKRIDREIRKVESKIKERTADLEKLENKFLGFFEVSNAADAELTETNLHNTERVDREACRRMLRQREREIESLYGEVSRLKELMVTTRTLNKAKTGAEFAEILETSQQDIQFENSLGMAFAAAGQTAKIELPKKIEQNEIITPYQILEGAAVNRSLEGTLTILEAAQKILAKHNDKAGSVEISSENPHQTASELSECCYNAIKEIDSLLLEKGKISPEESLKHEETFVHENPHLNEARKTWITKRQNAMTEIQPVITIAAQLPKRERHTPKRHKVEPDEPIMA